MTKRNKSSKTLPYSLFGLFFVLASLVVGIASISQKQIILEKAAVPQCPGAEQCPVAGYPDHLRSCTPPQADNSPDEQVCNTTGRIGTCGGQNWCCPVAGGNWTLNMSLCPTPSPMPTNNDCVNPNLNSNPWDVNQQDGVTIVDIGIIVDYYDKGSCLYPKADVNGDGTIGIVDIGIVIDHYNL